MTTRRPHLKVWLQSVLAERSGQKIILQRKLSDLRVQSLQVDGRLRRLCFLTPEHAGRAVQELVLLRR